jgi:hypothetical protein
MRTEGWLAVATFLTYACLQLGSVILEGDPDSLLGRAVTWLGGTFMAFGFAAVTLGVLLIPDGKTDGKLRRAAALVTCWASFMFAALQLLDDHVLNHPGISNPLGLAIPYQDYVEIPILFSLLCGFAIAVVTLPIRLARAMRGPKGQGGGSS